jgi:hypothetical protein
MLRRGASFAWRSSTSCIASPFVTPVGGVNMKRVKPSLSQRGIGDFFTSSGPKKPRADNDTSKVGYMVR